MNLFDYLDQTITVRLRNGETITSIVRNNHSGIYPVAFHNETYTNEGWLYSDTTSEYDIVEVISSNSNSSNNTNTMNQTPQTVQDFIDLFTAVKNEYGNISVRYSRSSSEAASEDCRLEFEDVVVVGGTKSLIRSTEQIDSPGLVFITY
jgi:4-hydroxy-3-methylbut-2-enyl diphosphate reductase IspH